MATVRPSRRARYAHRRDAFGQQVRALGEAVARSAAVSDANARALAHAERLVSQLNQALSNRAEIDKVIGILMSRPLRRHR